MKNKIHLKINSLIEAPELLIIAFLIVIIFYQQRNLISPLISLLSLSLSILLVCSFISVISFTKKNKLDESSKNQLKLIKDIIDILYTYESDKELCYKKLNSVLNLEELKKRSILDFESIKDNYKGIKNFDTLTRNEAEFYCLLDQGFTLRELTIIYKMNNPSSVYVKKHRIMSKIRC